MYSNPPGDQGPADAGPLGPDQEVPPDAYHFDVVSLTLQPNPDDADRPYLDLVVVRDGARRLLRFWEPADVQGASAGEAFVGKCEIDVTAGPSEGLLVNVRHLASSAQLGFWAREIDEIDR